MPNRLTDEALLERVRAAATDLGRTPNQREVPGWLAITRRFGSWNQALRLAGVQVIRRWTDEEMLDRLRDLAGRLGHVPTVEEVNADPATPSQMAYLRRFETHRDACAQAGLDLTGLSASWRTYSSLRDCALHHRYGLREADYWTLHARQDGRCRICREERGLLVDHCHETNRVRGLLCSPCNKAIGLVRDNPSTAAGMASYLLRAPTVAA